MHVGHERVAAASGVGQAGLEQVDIVWRGLGGGVRGQGRARVIVISWGERGEEWERPGGAAFWTVALEIALTSKVEIVGRSPHIHLVQQAACVTSSTWQLLPAKPPSTPSLANRKRAHGAVPNLLEVLASIPRLPSPTNAPAAAGPDFTAPSPPR